MHKPLLSGYVAGGREGGMHCEALEKELRAYYGAPYALVFNSATSALHSALVAVGVQRHDEVVTPAYTMSASAAAIIHAGGKPVFADIGDNYCVNRTTVKAVRTERTRALVLVYLFGHHLRWDWLPNAFPVVHDCSQAPTVRPHDHRLRGVWVYSLNQHKVLSCGEGGYALTFDGDVAERMHLMRNHGENVSPDILGHNYRMTEMQAEIARREFAELDDRVAARRKWAAQITATHDYQDNGNRDWYLFPIRVNGTPVQIQRVADRVRGHRGYTTPIHQLPWFQKHGYGCSLPNTEIIEREMVVISPEDFGL